MVIVGSEILQRGDADTIHAAVTSIANSVAKSEAAGWKTLNVLHRVSTFTDRITFLVVSFVTTLYLIVLYYSVRLPVRLVH